MTVKLKYLMTAYNTPNDNFTDNNISFYKSKYGLLNYTLYTVSLPLIGLDNIKIL